MKLVRAVIYGFGKWVDHSIDFSANAAIIYGEDESGKSTIQTFILFMLFGLPPKKRAFYRPKTSGKMGGRLVVSDPEIGEFTIERFDEVKNGVAVCYTPDGTVYDETWLQQRLHGMTYETYQSIYAFSAADLNNLHMMSDEDIGEILLGIGLTGSNNIHSLEKEFDKQIGKLFKPYGTKPVINEQLDKLAHDEKELLDWRKKEGTYSNKKEEVSDLTDELNEATKALRQEQMNVQRIENKKQALPLLQEYAMHQERLASFPDIIPFPENGKERLEKQQEQLFPLQSEYDFLVENEKKYEQKLNDLREQLKNQTVYERAKEIVEEKPAYLAKLKELEQMETHIQKREVQLESKMEDLAIPLEAGELGELQFPFYTENNWLQLKKEADQLRTEKEQLEAEQAALVEEHGLLNRQKKELNSRLLPEDQAQQLKEKVDLSEEEQVRMRIEEEREQQKKKWDRFYEQAQQRNRRMLLQLSGLAVILGLVAVFLSVDWLYPVIALLLLFACGNWLLSKRTAPDMDILDQEKKELKTTELDKETYTKMRRVLENNETVKKELASIQHDIKTNMIEQIKLEERRNWLEDRYRRLEQNIEENYDHYPFLKAMDVAYWPELYHRLENLIEFWKGLEEDRSALLSLKQEIIQFEQKLSRFMEKHEKTLYTINNPSLQLKEIESYAYAFEGNIKDKKEYKKMLLETKDKRKQLEQRMKVYQQAIDELLKAAQVETIDEFYKQAKKTEEKQDAESAVRRLERQLKLLFTESEWKQGVTKYLDEQKLDWQHEDSSKRVKQLEKEINALHKKIAELDTEITSMELSDTFSTLLHRFEMEKETLQHQAREWAVLKTAKEMLLQTKRSYRDKYLAKVMEKSTEFFRIVTDNKYKQVFPPTEENPFRVLDQDGSLYNAGELSKGTIDQLYISLRLAINEIMSEKHQLPFILDDPFIHFDSIRTQRMLQIIKSISESHQVILFTCRQEMIELANNIETIHLKKEVQRLS